jgi:two-component system, chemotaxis family, protein-glutamate methylesterase/glutaminase
MYARVHCYAWTMSGNVHSAASDNGFAAQVSVSRSFTAFDVVVVAASAGGISSLILLLNALPSYFPVPIVVAQHLASGAVYLSCLDRVLKYHTELRVKWAEDGEIALPGTVYLTPQDKIAEFNRVDRTIVTIPRSNCPPGTLVGNSLFESAAGAFEERVLAIILSGALSDGAEGAAEIARFGGRILAQSYGSCDFADMPRAAMKRSGVGLAFDPHGLAQATMALVMAPGASDWFKVGTERNSAIRS